MNNNIEELYVRPHRWFETEINGRLYKCKISRRGFTFGTICIKERMGIKKRKEYYFFGPMIDAPVFETITYSHRDDCLDPVMGYKTSYTATFIKQVIKQIIEQKPNPKHSYKI